jgi:trimeric autotransporter adhesin
LFTVLADESAINAKTIEIKFNTAIKANSVIGTVGTDDTLENGVVKIDSVDGSPAVTADSAEASLSEDGKTLTVKASGAEYFNGKYAITLSSSVVSTTDKALEAYSSIFSNVDSARPTVTGITYSDFQTAKIWFSEPLKEDGSVTFNSGSGASQGTFTAGDNFITVDLSGSTANENVTVTMIGGYDYNGNLVSPNPVTATVVKSTADAVKPTVSSTEVLSLDKFKVTFSEKLLSAPTITVDGNTVVSGTPSTGQVQGTVTVDSTGLVYTVDLASDLTGGLHTVGVPTFKDKSNNAGDAYTKVVNFAADTVDPTVTSATKQVISGKEYLVVEFSEDVTAADDKDITGTFVADYVTNNVTIVTDSDATPSSSTGEVSAAVTAVTGNTKAVKVELTGLAAGAYNVTLPTGFVTDAYGRTSVAKAVSFTRTTDTDVTKPALVAAYDTNGIQVDSNTSVTVKFDKKLDALSALNKSNYSIEGATISNVELIQNDATVAVVRLTLADSSIMVNGLRNVSVMNVKSASGVTMDAAYTTETFTENVRPTLTAAQLTANNEVTLTFSEAIAPLTLDEATDAVDFELWLNGTKYAATVAETVVTGDTKVKLTLNGTDVFTASDLTNGVVVKPASTIDIEDVNGNALSFTQVTAR